MASNWIEDVENVGEEDHQIEGEKRDDEPSEQVVEDVAEANEMDEEIRRILETHGLEVSEHASRSSSAHLQMCERQDEGEDEGGDVKEGRSLSRQISEESLDFFDKFTNIRELAERSRDVHQRRKRGAVESMIEAMNVNQVYAEYPARADKLSYATDDQPEEAMADELTPHPAPRSRPRSRASTPGCQWIWGPELTTSSEAENVYVEVLYSLVHAIGPMDSSSSSEIVNYLKQLYQFTDAKHDELLSHVSERSPPEVTLNLNVIQGRKLKGKDVNGMSDPYCSVWISSNRQKFHDTTMKERTLDPVWNETFTFSVKDVNEDTLNLEVWDYDPDETVREKMGRISEVKDFRGMGILLKQIANASKAPGKPKHGFMGLLTVPLKTIPLAGIERWYSLEGRDKAKQKERGDIRLSLSLSAVRTENQFTLQDSFVAYEHMVRIIVEHEMRKDPEWKGYIPETADALLRQFAAHRGLKQSVVDDCMWSVYATVLPKRALDFILLLNLIQRLRKAMADEKLSEEELISIFWAAAENFVSAALSVIRYLRNYVDVCSDANQISALLGCLKELQTLAPSRAGFSNMTERIVDAVTMGAADRWSRAFGGRRQGGPICDDDRMENAIRITQLLMADLKLVLTSHQEIFLRLWQVSPFSIAYLFYDGQLCGLTKPIVDSVTRSLKSVNTSEEEMMSLALEASGVPPDPNKNPNETVETRLTIGTALFELYVSIQQFHKLSIALPEQQREHVKFSGFYAWFSPAVSRWLDIAVFKALMRIGKAVNLDNFQPVDSMSKHSSSAVDTVTVFYQIKTFWDQLSWPDTEGALAFVIKIMDDVSRCTLFHAEAIRLKLDRIHSSLPLINKPFAISKEIYTAINSILRVRKSIDPLANDFGLAALCEAVRINNNEKAHEKTLEAITMNAYENIDAKLDEVFYTLSRRFEAEIAKLINAIVTSEFNDRSIDKLNSYICDQLCTLNSHIEADVFMRMLNIFRQRILQTFLNVLQGEVEKKRQPACFRQWEELLGVIDHCFRLPDSEDDEADDEILAKIRWLLKLHGADTSELIHLYRLERMKEAETDQKLGSLTVRAVFVDDNLNIDVLNARNLKRMDATGAADPYVKIQLLPSHHFPDAVVLKTKVHKNTLFPLFDDSFTYPVPKELQTLPECCIHFVVKDKDLIGKDEFMGETFLEFQRITRGDSAVEMTELEQIMLTLSMPPEKQSEYLEVLEGRTWDKAARDFAKKEKKHMGANK